MLPGRDIFNTADIVHLVHSINLNRPLTLKKMIRGRPFIRERSLFMAIRGAEESGGGQKFECKHFEGGQNLSATRPPSLG